MSVVNTNQIKPNQVKSEIENINERHSPAKEVEIQENKKEP